MTKLIIVALSLLFCPVFVTAQTSHTTDVQADAVVAKAVKFMGGDKYLGVKTLVGKGRFSIIREGRVISYQEFTDVIVFPDKERTDLKGKGIKTVQTNVGDAGWMFDGDHVRLIDPPETLIANCRRGI